jgi:glycosyltransferase involved in cell wall biosynthesis
VNPLNWLKVGRSVAKQKPDLVIIRYWLPFLGPCLGTIASQIRKNKHTTIICLADNIVPHEHRPGDRMFTNFFLGNVHGVIAMSKSVLTDALSFRKDIATGFCPHPIYDNYGELLPAGIAKQILELDQETKYLLFFGFIRDYKGLDLLIKAFADERLRRYPVKLLVAGEFYSKPDEYLKLIDELGLRDFVVLRTDFIPDQEVNLYFSAADMVVQPYKSATQSGVTQIGYHFNKPMLVTNVGGLSEIIPDGKVGYVVEPDEREIANAIFDFYQNNRMEEFEANVIQEKAKFSWSNMVNIFLSVFDNVKNLTK